MTYTYNANEFDEMLGAIELPDLESLGWNDRLSSLYEPYADGDVVAGRVSIQHRGDPMSLSPGPRRQPTGAVPHQ